MIYADYETKIANRIWNWFCQRVADKYFYRWLKKTDPDDRKGFDLYCKWIDKKSFREDKW